MLLLQFNVSSTVARGLTNVNRVIPSLLALLVAVAVPVVGLAQGQAVRSTNEYRFGPDDIIEITVFGKPELTGDVTIDHRGRIQVPLVGEVQASDRSPSELGEYLTERYQLLDPSITEVLVSIVEYKSRTVTVVGEVRSAGPYGFVEIPDLWEVILAAGGPSPEADLARVQIVRGHARDGEPMTLTVDLSANIDGPGIVELPQLYPADKVFVPSTEDVPVGTQDFQIIGAVGAPGTYRISLATNVIEALSASGGPLENADMSSVYLTRTEGERTRSWQLNLEQYLFAAQTPQNMDLLAGDTITVPAENTWLTNFRTIASVLIPIISLAITYAWATRS